MENSKEYHFKADEDRESFPPAKTRVIVLDNKRCMRTDELIRAIKEHSLSNTVHACADELLRRHDGAKG